MKNNAFVWHTSNNKNQVSQLGNDYGIGRFGNIGPGGIFKENAYSSCVGKVGLLKGCSFRDARYTSDIGASLFEINRKLNTSTGYIG